MDEEAMSSARAFGYVLRVPPEYDATRAAYSLTRRPDPRFAAAIERALGDVHGAAATNLIGLEREEARRALAEARRSARTRVVALIYDPEQAESLWLARDYLPELAARERERRLALEELIEALAPAEATVERVPVPHDIRDGMLGAFWRRPERYLDADALFAGIDPAAVDRAIAQLRNDIESGAWRRRYGGLLSREELDVGYRLVRAELSG